MPEQNDLTNDYLVHRENMVVASGTEEMIERVMRARRGAGGDATVAQTEQSPDDAMLDPFPTDKKPPTVQSTAGQVMRNVGETPGQAIAGVESAISNAVDRKSVV